MNNQMQMSGGHLLAVGLDGGNASIFISDKEMRMQIDSSRVRNKRAEPYKNLKSMEIIDIIHLNKLEFDEGV